MNMKLQNILNKIDTHPYDQALLITPGERRELRKYLYQLEEQVYGKKQKEGE